MVLSSPLYCDSCGAANRGQAIFCFACGQPLHSGKKPSPGPSTGLLVYNHLLKRRYRIISQIGRGGFGAVYKAADTHFGNRLVALKEMSQSGLTPQEVIEAANAFKREALLLASLTHPNLPRIYDHFSDFGHWYLAMDFIEGETLEERLSKAQGGYLPLEKALDITIQLCTVLGYLHSRQPPIIFRDLKPANVMLTSDGHVYLIDFGIARHFKPGQARDTVAFGSPGYAAPEQYGRTQTTPRSDIYSLGSTLHQMLTGDDPSHTPFHFASLQLHGQPTPVGLDKLIKQMLDMDASKRPVDMATVKQELQRILSQPPASHPKPSQSIGASNRAGQLKKTPLPLPQKNTLYVCRGHSSRITAAAWSPDGTRIVSASYDKTLRIWDAATGDSIFICRSHTDRVNAIAWSSDSKRICSAGNDGTVQLWEATTGKSMFTYRGHTSAVTAVAWSPDSTRIASAGEDKTVQVWDVVTGRTIYTHRGHSNRVLAVAWSADGRRIASGGEDKTVQVWSPFKDKSKFFSSFLFAPRGQFIFRGHAARVNAIAWAPDSKRIVSASSDKSMQVWDVLTGSKSFVHRNPSSGMIAVAWSPDGRRIASGSNDKTAQVWDAITRNSILTYRGHSGYVTAVAWSPDGKRIASAGVDRTLQIWQV